MELHRGTAGPLTNLRVRAYTMLTGLKVLQRKLGRNRLSDVPTLLCSRTSRIFG